MPRIAAINDNNIHEQYNHYLDRLDHVCIVLHDF